MDITNAVLYEKYKRKQQKTEWVKIGDVWILGKVTEGRFSGGPQGFKA